MSSRSKCNEALIVYNFLDAYTRFEKKIKNEFIENFNSLKEDYRNRVYFYLGGLGSVNTYIEYDTYSLIKETNRYDKKSLLNRLTMNQIMKLERKEQGISKFKQDISSVQRSRVTIPFCDCCIKLINTRNRMAHEFSDLKIKEADVIEILSKEKLQELKPEWLNDFEYDELDNNMLGILCNYIYMNEMEKYLI